MILSGDVLVVQLSRIYKDADQMFTAIFFSQARTLLLEVIKNQCNANHDKYIIE